MDDLYDSDRMIVVAIAKLLDGAYQMGITDKAPCLSPEQRPEGGTYTRGVGPITLRVRAFRVVVPLNAPD